jgi:hypothetical protein
LELAQYLLTIDPLIDICAKEHDAFIQSCRHKKLQTAQWLASLKPNLYHVKKRDSFSFPSFDWEIKQIIPINSEKTVKTNRSNLELTCPICYESEIYLQTNCKHNFCLGCVENFYESNNSCPFCRTQITQFNKIELI